MSCSRKLFDEMPLRDAVSWTNLMKGYVKQGQLTTAQELFDEMPHRNEVSWVVIIAGYVKVGRYHDAIELFNSMLQSSSNRPNEAALVLVLSACTHIGAVSQGRWIHAYIDKHTNSQ
ncbi:hypothetical protein HPP92_010605 [Vanilla planifolia]|uniref:Pentatricopeptide repeat-containing protein n=1 Tax=Vanilla planifolia TaxID=51239 RepID=A0A835R4E7_VANPL|nr:hypothetical protein HPP92_010605 [Vanilla planifolia]